MGYYYGGLWKYPAIYGAVLNLYFKYRLELDDTQQE